MTKKYLLDTNILIYHQRGKFDLLKYLRDHGISELDCYISEITVIELGVGEIMLSRKGYKFRPSYKELISNFSVLPISNVVDLFITEKCRLQFEGTPQENNFDLLIGCTSVVDKMILVTENVKDFRYIKDIKIENWIVKEEK